jgi:hypothetical protein
MQFERGLDPKEAIGIGLKANAPIIDQLYIEDISMDGERGTWTKELHAINHSDVPQTLIEIEMGQLPAEQYHFEEEQPIFGNAKLKHLRDYSGKCVKYLNNKSFSAYDDPDQPILLTFFIPIQDEL